LGWQTERPLYHEGGQDRPAGVAHPAELVGTKPGGRAARAWWVKAMWRIAEPVLTHLGRRQLKAAMPVEARDPARREYTHLEAVGRTLMGIAPWLESGGGRGEEELCDYARRLARESLDAATDPVSPDYCNFHRGAQPIVDAAFLAQAILRAPRQLWERLEPRVQRNVIAALKATRYGRKPAFNNWLLFSAIIEAALARMGESDWDRMRVDYALRQHEQWYVGDGVYGDGPHFRWDYYNSYVIQPMLIDVLEAVGSEEPDWERMKEPVLRRAQRFAEVLERLISPEGTYPLVGRSSSYRFAAFQVLAQMAWMRRLPTSLSPAQVRCALTAVIRRTLEAPGTFDGSGWLRIGVAGHQPEVGESYISTGSLYLCTAVFLPLGLPLDDPFWSDPDQPWTAKKIWEAGKAPMDRAIL